MEGCHLHRVGAEGATDLHEKLDFIPSHTVLVPVEESGLVDCVKHEVRPLQQCLAVQQSCPDTVVL